MKHRIVFLLLVLMLGAAGSARAATLTIYSRLDYAPAVARAFTAKTGVAVRIRRPPPIGLADRIRREGSHPRWSLAWFAGTATATALDAQELLAPNLPVPPDLSATARGLVPADRSAIPTGIELGGILLLAGHTPFTPPADWADLAAPSYRGLIGMADPGTDDAAWGGLASLLATDGWPAGKLFVTRLKADGLHIYSTSADTIAALRSGAIQLALVHSAIGFHVATRIDSSLKLAIPQPAVLMPILIVMPRGIAAVQRQAAEAFIAFVDSAAGQKAALAQNDMDTPFWPVTSTETPSSLPPLAGIETRPPTMITPYAGAAIAWFARDIVGHGL